MEFVITTQNESYLAWLRAKGIQGENKGRVSHTDIVHRNVIGHLPHWLAAYTDTISEIAVPRLSRYEREQMSKGLLSVADMDAAGAHLVTYQVRRVSITHCEPLPKTA